MFTSFGLNIEDSGEMVLEKKIFFEDIQPVFTVLNLSSFEK